jgi:hypothetical protein
MSFSLRIIALLLAFTLPAYGFAGISKECSSQGAEQVTSSAVAVMAMDGGVDAASDTHIVETGLETFELGSSCSSSNGGQQCQMGILLSSITFAEPAIASSPSQYFKFFAQVYLELPQRPPLLA